MHIFGSKVPIAFGQLKDLNEFGQLIRDNDVAKLNIEDANVTDGYDRGSIQNG